MEARDLYAVLGVPRTETASGIRHAFRELAQQYHPDRAGARDAPFFQDIVEAYRVLADPQRRSSYDRGLQDAAEAGTATRRPIAPAFRPEPEPPVAMRLSLLRDFHVTAPSFDEVLDHFFRGFTEPSMPKSQRLDALNLQLLLSADEAARGGALLLGVPVFYPCRTCRGSGYTGPYACLTCDTQGMVEEEEEVRVVIPARVRDGTVLRIPLRGLGINNLYLQLFICVE